MDSQHATVVGRENAEPGGFVVLAHEESEGHDSNSGEKAAHHIETGALHKLFKSITAHMQNVDEIHVTGTGVAQEQFIKYLAQVPQFKNAVAKESTSEKMSEKSLVEYISEQFK